MIIRATDSITIDGVMDLSGSDGVIASGGAGGPGGQAGKQGKSGGSRCTSVYFGSQSTINHWWLSDKVNDFSNLAGLQGGNGGGYYAAGNCDGGGGGGSGGVLVLIAPQVTINGSINLTGGKGSKFALCNGDDVFDFTTNSNMHGCTGTGGILYIRATSLAVNGSIAIWNGLTRIDAHSVTGTPPKAIYGSTVGVGSPFRIIWNPSTKELALLNSSATPVNAVLHAR